MKVRWSRLALAELEAAAAYIEQRNPEAAKRLMARIDAAAENLALSPLPGRLSKVQGVRKQNVARTKYILVFEMREAEEEILILRVYHGARNMPY
jgi:addiction module RelE/StbE family toxin